MPYVIKGKCVYHKMSSGKLIKKGCSKSTAMAKRYMKALYAAEGGAKMGAKGK